MTTKLELIQAAQSAAVSSLALTGEAKITEARKQAFSALGVPAANRQFFNDHFNGARSQYAINAEAPLETDATAKP